MAVDPQAFAATEDVVKARLRQLDCRFAGVTITAFLYATQGGQHFHIPKPFSGVGYTVGQLAKIEAMLVAFGLDLYPLDYGLVSLPVGASPSP